MGNTCCPPPRENPKGSQQTGQTGFDNQIPEKQQSSFNKEKCKSIAKGLPTRTQIDYHSFKELLKSKTNNLSQIEKCYVKSFKFNSRFFQKIFISLIKATKNFIFI